VIDIYIHQDEAFAIRFCRSFLALGAFLYKRTGGIPTEVPLKFGCTWYRNSLTNLQQIVHAKADSYLGYT
jgi:hypothetical protein